MSEGIYSGLWIVGVSVTHVFALDEHGVPLEPEGELTVIDRHSGETIGIVVPEETANQVRVFLSQVLEMQEEQEPAPEPVPEPEESAATSPPQLAGVAQLTEQAGVPPSRRRSGGKKA